MNERLHPDGLPVNATPYTDKWHDEYVYDRLNPARSYFGEIAKLERRAREAETRVAELEGKLISVNVRHIVSNYIEPTYRSEAGLQRAIRREMLIQMLEWIEPHVYFEETRISGSLTITAKLIIQAKVNR